MRSTLPTVNINGVTVPMRHAAFARFAVDGYQYLTKKRKMSPFPRTPPSSNRRPKKIRTSAPMPAPNNRPVPLTKATSRHRGKPTNHKRGKKVKVTKQFKDKVTKALEAKTVSGSWDQISFDRMRMTSFQINEQIVTGLGAEVGNDFSDWAFDPEDILHAASVLWNKKTDSQVSRSWFDPANLFYSGTNANITIDAPQTSAVAPYNMSGKIVLKNAYEVYKLKNNSQRTVVMKIYLCAPKHVGSKNTTNNQIPAAPGVIPDTETGVDFIGSPEAVWINECNKQIASYINLANAEPQTLYNSPKDCPGFNKVYRTDCTTVVLEPGQVYDYYIQGPQNFTIDYNTLFRATNSQQPLYLGVQKFMRYPLITAYLDLITDGDRVGHYPPSLAVGSSQNVSIERQMKMSIECPHTAGINFANTSTTGGVATELNMRRDCYYRTVYGMTGPTLDLNRVDVQNPTMVMDQT